MGSVYNPTTRSWSIEDDDEGEGPGEGQPDPIKAAAVQHALAQFRRGGRPGPGRLLAELVIVGDRRAHRTIAFAVQHCGIRSKPKAVAEVWRAVAAALLEGPTAAQAEEEDEEGEG